MLRKLHQLHVRPVRAKNSAEISAADTLGEKRAEFYAVYTSVPRRRKPRSKYVGNYEVTRMLYDTYYVEQPYSVAYTYALSDMETNMKILESAIALFIECSPEIQEA